MKSRVKWGVKLVGAIINEMVSAAKQFIDGELAKYETWEDFRASNESIRSLVGDEQAWHKLRATGAGQTTILKFLGGNWKDSEPVETGINYRRGS